jgi:magnesium transporter
MNHVTDGRVPPDPEIRPGKPGVASLSPGALYPNIEVTAYNQDELVVAKLESFEEIRPLLDKFSVTWLNVDGPASAEVLAEIGKTFGLHHLALEDVARGNQRVKVELYKDHFFIVARMISPDRKLEIEQLSLFFGEKFVITFQERPGGDCLGSVRDRLRKDVHSIRAAKADHLAYAILDAAIDGYMPAVDNILERLEVLDAEIVKKLDSRMPAKIHAIKDEVLTLRRAVRPLRDAVNQLIRDGGTLVSPDTRMALRDCYDHTIRLIDDIEMAREKCDANRDLHMVSINNRLSEVMRVLTIITVIFTPPIFIAGIYGMNFNPEKSPLNMPELNWFWGYPFALGLMVVLDIALLVFLYYRGLLGDYTSSRSERRQKRDD